MKPIALRMRMLLTLPMLPILLCLFCLSSLCGAAAAAEQQGSTDLSNASNLVAEGSALVVGGSLSMLAASGTVIVDSVEATGEASVVVLAGASDAAQATVRISARAARGVPRGWDAGWWCMS